MLKNCEEVAKELTNFLFNAVKNLDVPSYENCDSFAENINDSTLKALVKWKNHPSILDRTNYCFNFVSKENIIAEIKPLHVSKAIEENDISVKSLRHMKRFVIVSTNQQKTVYFLIV